MAYVLYTPPTHPAPSFGPTDGAAARAVGRIVGPLRTGFTQYRIGGTWQQKAVPTTTESLLVDTDIDGQELFLQGGHWYWIREELLAEITGDDLDLGEYRPSSDGLYPSETTYPGSTVYPGVPA